MATADSLTGAATKLSHPLLDANASARFVVTHVLDPEGAPTTPNPNPIGIVYLGASGEWAIFNENGVRMPEGAAFFVRIPGDVAGFVHTATDANRTANHTRIDDPAAGDASSTLFVTQHMNAGGSGTVLNPSNIGVYRFAGTWRVFNQDPSVTMPLGADFVVLRPYVNTFVHHATPSNLGATGTFTFLTHPSLDGDPSAMLHVTANWNPDGGGVYNDHPVAVFYDEVEGIWAIANVDAGPMQVGASWNVWIQ